MKSYMALTEEESKEMLARKRNIIEFYVSYVHVSISCQALGINGNDIIYVTHVTLMVTTS